MCNIIEGQITRIYYMNIAYYTCKLPYEGTNYLCNKSSTYDALENEIKS